jgi:hypothetical protein
MNVFSALIGVADTDNKFLNNIITRNAAWFYLYNPQTNSNLLNGNQTKNTESIGVMGRLRRIFFGGGQGTFPLQVYLRM